MAEGKAVLRLWKCKNQYLGFSVTMSQGICLKNFKRKVNYY